MKDIDKELVVFVPVYLPELPDKPGNYIVKQNGWAGHRHLLLSGKDFFDKTDYVQDGIIYWLKEVPANDYAEDKVKELIEVLLNALKSCSILIFDVLKVTDWTDEEKVKSAIKKVQSLKYTSYAEDKVKKLQERLREAKELLKEYESWEAELIADNRCWEPEGMASLPTLTNELYEKMVELQSKRNDIFL